MNINKNLFDLNQEEESMSKTIYNGKIIKCLVAPYHSYADLEKTIPYTKNTYLFPEREFPVHKISALISAIVANPSNEEFRIITANQNIILDMVDTSVRVLTEDGDVIPCPIKTFMANIHDIRYSLLENESHRSTKKESTKSENNINKLINRINDKNPLLPGEYDKLKSEISLIGEDLIRVNLLDMLDDKV